MHALAYSHVSKGSLTACCDLEADRRGEFAREFNLKHYAGITEMVTAEKPDLVHLVTAPSTRVELMNLVDSLGVPGCLVEKPVALEVRDWRELVTLSRRPRTKFAVGAQFRYHPDLTRCRAALASGMLGSVRRLEFSAVGTICDQGVHGLDWAMSLNEDSPPVRVFGTVSGSQNLTHPMHPSPDTSTAQILFANGVIGYWTNGNAAPRVMEDPEYYKHGQVAACTARGHILYEEFGRWEIETFEGIQFGHADDRGWMEGNHLAQAALTDAMFTWLEGGEPVGTHLDRALVQWNAVLGLYLSAIEKRPVMLPCEPPDDLWDRLVNSLS